jgi:hypothetical protein
MADVSNRWKEHHPGSPSQKGGTRIRASLSAPSKGLAGNAGSPLSTSARGAVCSRVLLAPTPQLPESLNSGVEVLG